MEFFIDTGDLNEIKTAYAWGFVDGVTTNPSLVAKSGKNQKDLIREIAEIVDGPISAEVIATDSAGMIKEGEELAKIHTYFLCEPGAARGEERCHLRFSLRGPPR